MDGRRKDEEGRDVKAPWRIKVGPARQAKVITGTEPIYLKGSLCVKLIRLFRPKEIGFLIGFLTGFLTG